MTTYYKYAEREAASTIDWTAISKSLVNTLSAESKRREELKAEIEKNSIAFGEKLDNAPQGEYKNANTWVLNAADQGTKARLMQDKLLKSGQLKLKDYLVQRQNLESDFRNIFSVAKEYQEEYKTKMEAYKKGESSGVTVDMMETIEGLANLTNTNPYINPTTGVVSLAKTEMKDGVQESTGEFVSVSALRNRIKMNVNKFNTETLSEDVKALGSTVVSDIRKTQGLRRIIAVEKTKDPTVRKALEDDPEIGTYVKWENARVDEYLANPFNAVSILKDYVRTNETGEGFKITYSREEWEKDNSGKLYLMEDDGSGVLKPILKKEQEQQVRQFIKNEYRNMIDREQTIDVATEPDVYRPSPAELDYYRKVSEDKNKTSNNLNMAAKLYYGNDTEAKAAAQYFRDNIPNVKDVNRTKDGVVLTFEEDEDGKTKTRTISFKDGVGNVISQQDWLASAVALHGIEDVKSAIRQSGFRADKSFNPDAAGRATTTVTQSKVKDKESIVDNRAVLNKLLGKTSVAELAVEDNPKKTADALNKAYKSVGFSFQPEVKGLANQVDYVKIYKDGKYIGAVEISESGAGAAEIEKYMRDTIDAEYKSNFNTGTPDSDGGDASRFTPKE